jgi:anthranilate phosphoribosyltransferase
VTGHQGTARDIVVLNTAAALIVAGVANDLADGVQKARAALDSGAAERKLAELTAFRG